MNMRKIRYLAELMRETGLSELEIKEEGESLRLSRAVSAPAVQAALPQIEYMAVQPAAEAPTGQEEIPGCVTVNSPMVGVFYAAPSPEAKPFVAVGDTVAQGDILCIVEAMKLMNEVVAEQAGTVVEILAGNGQIVEFGQPMFRLKP